VEKASSCEARKCDPGSANALCCAACVLVADADAACGCHGRRHRLRTLCVVVAGAVRGVAVMVIMLRVVYAATRGGDGAARRDAATWRMQPGRARQGGGMSASSLWSVIIGRVCHDHMTT
jgi:hypothetical protein